MPISPPGYGAATISVSKALGAVQEVLGVRQSLIRQQYEKLPRPSHPCQCRRDQLQNIYMLTYAVVRDEDFAVPR